jgi:hypothetical protein
MTSIDGNAPFHLPEARAQRTSVIVRFEPLDDKSTRIMLEHTGWCDGGEWGNTYALFDGSWGNVLENLKICINRGRRTGRGGSNKCASFTPRLNVNQRQFARSVSPLR